MAPTSEQLHIPEGSWTSARACNNSACVQVANLPGGGRAVRDSKDPAGPVQVYDAAEWAAFTDGVRAGDFA